MVDEGERQFATSQLCMGVAAGLYRSAQKEKEEELKKAKEEEARKMAERLEEEEAQRKREVARLRTKVRTAGSD